MIELEKYRRSEIYALANSHARIYIYGAGGQARKTYVFIKSLGINISGFLVTNMGNNPLEIEGKKVLPLADVNLENNTLVIIGVSEQYQSEIIGSLLQQGVENILRLITGEEIWKKKINFPSIEITAKIGCKIHCKYCPQDLLCRNYFKQNPNRKAEMLYEDYKICLSHMPKNTVVTFAGFIEPFFHKNGVDMILAAHEQGFDIELYTTLMGLTLDQFHRISHIPYREVVLHTPDKMHYANIQITEEYKRILDEALDLKKSDGRPFIDSANCQSEASEEFLNIAKNRILVESSLLDRAGNLKNDSNLRTSSFKRGKLSCVRTRDLNHWVLLPDGEVVLCCMDFGLQHPLGNLITNTYDEIINSKAYKDIISKMNDINDSSMLCRKCVSSRVVE